MAIPQIEVNSVHADVSADVREYANKKIGSLVKFLPAHMRLSAHMEIHLKEDSGEVDKYICGVTIYLPNWTVVAHEKSPEDFQAAIDLAEASLKNQLEKRHKELHRK